ncbi:F0F1 ATP synthase subunit epsilon [Paraoerskovia marina]|uniref:ATP synthase epsilon chain n=1 Tax=Paraoerskovia marina TaxID=545619 RepID=A0A1H1R576_9CELL|nr:F0F1 ATP synthase subunit epsilon [Paraoerskovia marina]SDS30820.1 ATP synthase F1 subcomplex epsilon subunit [Paraoerskovia marina]
MAHLNVDIVATDRKIWSGVARGVTAPASEGEVGIRVGHAPLLASLRAGRVVITPVEGAPVSGTVTGGFLSVDADQVTIVADQVEVHRGEKVR